MHSMVGIVSLSFKQGMLHSVELLCFEQFDIWIHPLNRTMRLSQASNKCVFF